MNDVLNAAAAIRLPDISEALNALKNPEIPLDERWNAYEAMVKNKVLNSVNIYGDGYIDELGNNITLYDDFYIERHETLSFVDMYERILENAEDQGWLGENIETWREKVLASGYSAFTYDW